MIRTRCANAAPRSQHWSRQGLLKPCAISDLLSSDPWCKGPYGPVEGPMRRRSAEEAHATEAADSGTPTPAPQQGLIQLAVPDLSQGGNDGLSRPCAVSFRPTQGPLANLEIAPTAGLCPRSPNDLEMGRLRFELRTNRLKAECSTAELTTRPDARRQGVARLATT